MSEPKPYQPPTPRTPAEVLINLIITLLAPLFLTAARGNIAFARMAAAETINGYRARTNADLITIAQIIAFGLTALASLSQSMDDDIPLSLSLRLRGNANACNRSAEQNRRALILNENQPEPQPEPSSPEPPNTAPPPAEPDAADLIAKTAETQKRTAENLAGFASTKPAPTRQDRHHQAAWAAGAARVAAETAAGLDSLPPEERRSAAIWADILNECAKDLMTSDPAPRPSPSDLPQPRR